MFWIQLAQSCRHLKSESRFTPKPLIRKVLITKGRQSGLKQVSGVICGRRIAEKVIVKVYMMVVRSAAMYGLDSCDGFIGSDHKAEKHNGIDQMDNSGWVVWR